MHVVQLLGLRSQFLHGETQGLQTGTKGSVTKSPY